MLSDRELLARMKSGHDSHVSPSKVQKDHGTTHPFRKYVAPFSSSPVSCCALCSRTAKQACQSTHQSVKRETAFRGLGFGGQGFGGLGFRVLTFVGLGFRKVKRAYVVFVRLSYGITRVSCSILVV